MSISEISNSVEKLKRKYNETDPFHICRDMGIKILFSSMGSHDTACKGFYLECKRIRTITINADLPIIVQKIIAAHELGHAINHRNHKSVHAFHEIPLFDESNILEKEANLFAAELLLDDEDVLYVLNCDTSFFDAAAALYVPPELLDFKFRVMKWKGYKIMEPPITASGDFLKDMNIPINTDFDIC